MVRAYRAACRCKPLNGKQMSFFPSSSGSSRVSFSIWGGLIYSSPSEKQNYSPAFQKGQTPFSSFLTDGGSRGRAGLSGLLSCSRLSSAQRGAAPRSAPPPQFVPLTPASMSMHRVRTGNIRRPGRGDVPLPCARWARFTSRSSADILGREAHGWQTSTAAVNSSLSGTSKTWIKWKTVCSSRLGCACLLNVTSSCCKL